MKCPSCNYENGFNDKTFVKQEGDRGDFELSPQTNEDTFIVICPQCKTEFMPS